MKNRFFEIQRISYKAISVLDAKVERNNIFQVIYQIYWYRKGNQDQDQSQLSLKV